MVEGNWIWEEMELNINQNIVYKILKELIKILKEFISHRSEDDIKVQSNFFLLVSLLVLLMAEESRLGSFFLTHQYKGSTNKSSCLHP